MTRPDSPSVPPSKHGWRRLGPGALLQVVKMAPDGSEAARYGGQVVVSESDDGWLVIHAIWTHRLVELDGLSFSAADNLLEWFSPRQFFNVFAVLTPAGRLKGWYANVSQPARLDDGIAPPVLTWHDLYVDLVALPDGNYTIRDDDELAAAGLERRDPALYMRILDARSAMIAAWEERTGPFAVDPERLWGEARQRRTCADS